MSHHSFNALCVPTPLVLRCSFLNTLACILQSASTRPQGRVGHLLALKPDEGVDGLWDVFWGACWHHVSSARFFFSSTGGYGHLSVNHYITSTPRLSFPFFLFLDFKVLYHKVLIRIIAKKNNIFFCFSLPFLCWLSLPGDGVPVRAVVCGVFFRTVQAA